MIEDSEKTKLSAREELLGKHLLMYFFCTYTKHKYKLAHMYTFFIDLRKRNVGKSEAAGNMDQVLNFHQDMHEKIAEQMLELTTSLKEHSSLANKIIRKDTEVTLFNM